MTLEKLAIIAGEPSGDILAADLVAALTKRLGARPELIGVGGEALQRQGLKSLFDQNELSIIGFSAVIARLPKLIWRIRQTANAIIEARPDCLIIVDSPDFTHRVARRVRKALPDLKIINYVCPTVWAWKPERARAMTAYVDHVLSVLPFEPEVVAELGGPSLTYVGHRLMFDPGLMSARAAQAERASAPADPERAPVCLILPGSRGSEIDRLIGPFAAAAAHLARFNPAMRFVLPASPRVEAQVREAVSGWRIACEVVSGEAAKWRAFGEADIAIAASGTVLLELAIVGVPHMSSYKLDFIARRLVHKLTTWSMALPNLIAGHVVIQEQYDNHVLPERLARIADNLARDTMNRAAMLADFGVIRGRMRTDAAPSETAADVVLAVLGKT